MALYEEAEQMLNNIDTNDDEEYLPIIRKIGRALEITECFPTKIFCNMFHKLRDALYCVPSDPQDLFCVQLCDFTYLQISYTILRINNSSDIVPTICEN